MAFTLKSSGIATSVVACIGLDDDNATAKDFVAANNETFDANVTYGTASWKGATRGYFQTKANGGFNFYGVTWAATKPSARFADGMSFFACFNSYTSGSWMWNASINGIQMTGGKPGFYVSSGFRNTASTSLPTGGTKFSSAGNFKANATANAEMFYGLESGSLASDSTPTTPTGLGSNQSLDAFGGASGQGNFVCDCFLLVLFNTPLTLSDFQSLHDDPWGTLFDTGGGGGFQSAWARGSNVIIQPGR
jgi:hypothetical protein